MSYISIRFPGEIPTLNSKLTPVDLTDKLVSNNRITATKKKCLRYPNGKVEIYIEGVYATSLAANQQAIYDVTSGYNIIPASRVVGVASSGNNAVACYMTGGSNTGIAILHGGAIQGDNVSLFLTFFV